MPPASPDLPPRTLTDLLLGFCLGAVVGCLLALVPLSYVWYFHSGIMATQLLVLLAFGVLGGILGMFSNPQQIGRFFDSIPWF